MENLTKEQAEYIVKWMNEWEQLKDTVIPMRFKADFKPNKQMDDVKHLYDEKIKIEFVHGLTIVKGMYMYHILTNEEIDPKRYDEIKDAIESITNGELDKLEMENYLLRSRVNELEKMIDQGEGSERSVATKD